MSAERYNNPPGAAQKHSDLGHYSQSVDLGNGAIKCSGQGGWDANDSDNQIESAMKNVDVVLKAASLRGWEDVYLLRSYNCDIRTSWAPTTEPLRQRIPGHRPVWTAIGVANSATPIMLIELEVEARRSS